MRSVLDAFFALCPDATSCSVCDEAALADLLRPLGLYNRRAASLRRFSAEYLLGGATRASCTR